MPVFKAFVRILGVAWVGLLVALALKFTPHVQATDTGEAKASRNGPRELVEVALPEPVQNGPRVVYQGPITQGIPAQRPVDPRPAGKPTVVAEAARQEPAPVPTKPAPSLVASSAWEPATPVAAPAARAEPLQELASLTSKALDLNTASADELNGLKGAGKIGRAIVQGRPYRSPEDLLAKRILNRATFAQIKDQVAVR